MDASVALLVVEAPAVGELVRRTGVLTGEVDVQEVRRGDQHGLDQSAGNVGDLVGVVVEVAGGAVRIEALREVVSREQGCSGHGGRGEARAGLARDLVADDRGEVVVVAGSAGVLGTHTGQVQEPLTARSHDHRSHAVLRAGRTHTTLG